jgi:hypothetical protein
LERVEKKQIQKPTAWLVEFISKMRGDTSSMYDIVKSGPKTAYFSVVVWSA